MILVETRWAKQSDRDQLITLTQFAGGFVDELLDSPRCINIVGCPKGTNEVRGWAVFRAKQRAYPFVLQPDDRVNGVPVPAAGLAYFLIGHLATIARRGTIDRFPIFLWDRQEIEMRAFREVGLIGQPVFSREEPNDVLLSPAVAYGIRVLKDGWCPERYYVANDLVVDFF